MSKPKSTTTTFGNGVLQGDAKEMLKELEADSFHSCVTDPPYELGFMNRQWDDSGIAFDVGFWEQVKRVLKPGAHLLAFGGSRTHHRMMAAIEDAGFEIRDTLMWVYGCVSPDTDILTSEGWKSHDEVSINGTAVCYDKNTGRYQYGPIQQKLEKYNQLKAYRIQGDRTDQIVSPEHRVLVERGGNLEFERAWRLARQQKISVPVLENLQSVRNDISGYGQIAIQTEQNLQRKVRKEPYIEKPQWKTEDEKQRLYYRSNLQKLWRSLLEKTRSDRWKEFLYKRMPYGMAKRKRKSCKTYAENCCNWNRRMGQKAVGKTLRTDDRKNKSELEGGSNLQEWKRKLRRYCTRQVPERVRRNGKEKRLRARTQAQSGKRNRQAAQKRRSGASHRPRSSEQRNGEFNAVSEQSRAQTLRAQRQPETDLATIKPIENYDDMVWCVKVPTGAFVARRNGKIFVTGNSGFPKNHDISKAIDDHFDEDRKVVGTKQIGNSSRTEGKDWESDSGFSNGQVEVTEPATEEAKKWEGWGTALKPGYEPICLARKPLSENTIAENVLKHSTGALNIDGCRIGGDGGTQYVSGGEGSKNDYGDGLNSTTDVKVDGLGRWPNNLMLDDRASILLDRQSGDCPTGDTARTGKRKEGSGWGMSEQQNNPAYKDKGGASRFFYCPKAHKNERNIGADNNDHPTVKPVELIAYLIRLSTPPEGRTLDPFGGSGTAGIAAVLEQKDFVLIEKNKDHAELAQSRIEHVRNNMASVRKQIFEDPSNNLTEQGAKIDHDFW